MEQYRDPKEMNKLLVFGLVFIIALIIPASAFTFLLIDFNQRVEQNQEQNQQQSQKVSITIPQNSNGILISGYNGGQGQVEPSAKLDIGIATQSRYMPKGEVLVYEIMPGTIVSIKAASDIGLYSIGFQADDADKVSTEDAIPTYDAVYHRMGEQKYRLII